MKLLIFFSLLVATPQIILAGSVKGYTNGNGTYVQPYVRVAPAPVVKPVRK